MRIVIRFIVLAVFILWIFKFTDNKDVAKVLPEKKILVKSETSNLANTEIVNNKFSLSVPYISEAPEGNWSGDWVNACEEATIAMVDNYYKKGGEVSVTDAKNYLQNLFDRENELYGHNKNTDANQILELINLYASFRAEIKTNPTIDEIKSELLSGRPIISLHRGFDLKNPNIPFSPIKSSYHTVVVVGFDDISKEFITHDPGDENDGINHRYSYSDFMFSLHDYNKEADKTDGVPTILFTKEQ